MAITHQDIAARLVAVDEEYTAAENKAYTRLKAELLSLQELCGSLGHDFSGVRWVRVSLSDPQQPAAHGTECCVCGQELIEAAQG